MHNMSNQFYKYVTNTLVDYFENNNVSVGDRYVLQLERQEDVNEFIKAFSELDLVDTFCYQHQFGEPYETIALKINHNVLLVIAHTSDQVNPDFLVTIRNQVGEQKDVWNGTALLSIVSSQLDSIQGGSSDLQKEGMPLHPNSIINALKQEIESSPISKVEKIILLDRMEQIILEQHYQHTTFFEFEDILIALNKERIEEDDYRKFGIFRDSELDTLTGSKLKERLDNNRELYHFIKKCHEYGFDNEKLQKRFSNSGIQKIQQTDWELLNFNEIWNYHQQAIELNKKVKVELKEISVKNKYSLWNRPQNDTTAGKRRRHIMVFNNSNIQDKISIVANFEIEGGGQKSLSERYVNVERKYQSTTTVTTGRANLTIHITPEPNKITFSKVSYRHDNKSSLGAELFIAVIPTDEITLECFKTTYLVDPKLEVLCSQYDGRKIVFGYGYERKEIELSDQDITINYHPDQQIELLTIPEAFNDEDQLKFHLNLVESGVMLPFLLINDVPDSVPITPFRIWKLKRESCQNFILANNRLIFGNREYYITNDFKQFLDWEYKWLDSSFKCAEIISGSLVNIDVDLSDDLKEAYSRYLNYYTSNQTTPSLSYYSTELIKRATEYVTAFNNEIISLSEGQPAGRKGRNLFKLGTILSQQGLYMTPFHPLIVAYQLQLYKEISIEDVDNNILSRLKPDALVPFLYNENDVLLRPYPQYGAIEWLEYRPVTHVSVSDANKYLARLIEDKIEQFQEHFSYLFHSNSKAPLKINLIGIENDFEVVRGILRLMINSIKSHDLEFTKTIEVSLYQKQNTNSSFDLFSRLNTVDEFQNIFGIDLTKDHEHDPLDIIRLIHSKLLYFKRLTDDQFEYAHITFYKMQAQEHHAILPMTDMVSGMALDGLYSFVPSMKSAENYRTGFGIKSFPSQENSNILIQTTVLLNELCANLRNGGNDSYTKSASIVSRTTAADEQVLMRIYQASHWVTFIDSNVDLEFFSDDEKNLIIIHYSDQYSSSYKYDAITVTDKTQQYYPVIQEFLTSKGVDASEYNIKHAIKAFNTFNGEWLLRIISDKGHYSREKLSIISAIKYSLSYFDHKDIIWVPISLEEILRVAGAVSLNKSDGVFTAKNLGVKGVHSDDLLLVGLENNGNSLSMHFYPIEVKIGRNGNNVLEKAKLQVKKTKQLIIQALGEEGHARSFTSKFYRYFFVQLFITNANKLDKSGFWPEKNYLLPDWIIQKLLADDFNITTNLKSMIGLGAVLSFQHDAFYRSANLEDDITIVTLPEQDGFNGIIKSMKDMFTWIQSKHSDFIKENMLSYLYGRKDLSNAIITTDGSNLYDTENGDNSHSIVEGPPPQKVTPAKIQDESITAPKPIVQIDKVNENIPSQKNENSTIRVLLGRAENSNHLVYWEFGNKELPNRHLLISGKSGQGKTYFMQCLLLELSKIGVSSIVVDYTEGFLPNQLEPEFKEFFGSKLIQRVIYTEKFPINPFKKNIRDIGGITLPESNTDIAERIKSVFSSVYKSLGIQQLNAIYEATLTGLEKYGDEMTLDLLRRFLEEDSNSYSKTALSQIRPLIDRDPFTKHSSLNWDEILTSKGNVFIIQLTGYPRDVQLIITEFILWDLWNHSLRVGNKEIPIPVLLDEAQNLDHSEKSPSSKILTEGRKFGWSGWYATQFLKSQLDSDELARLQNASQKVYFAQPEQEISYVLNSISTDSSGKKLLESKLASLKKGQCIVHGPVVKELGGLSSPRATVIEVIPLSERI